jgi:succinoglycan biosynthesis transport protein ExoP
LDDRPGSYNEMEKLFDEPVLGQIPFMKAKRKKGVPYLQWDDERHILVEAYRNLRSGLVFNSPEKPSKTIVVTSAVPNDGKSMTAANLAITLARAGDRVLLVDADLRRGMIHKNFSLPGVPGLTEVLSDQCKLPEAIVQTAIPNLYLLSCGTAHRHPGGLFVSGARKFLKEIAAADYDYYVFDTPPVMATDDVSNLAPHVDCVLMVVRAGFTSGRVARAALNVLYSRKVKAVGLVLNAVRASAGEYYYYRYPEYYSQRPPA